MENHEQHQSADRTPCPWCAEPIRAEALRCPHCRTRTESFRVGAWHRAHPDARLAGVAVAVSEAFTVPVATVRLGFVLATFLSFAGPLAYAALWLLLPTAPGQPSTGETLVREAAAAWGRHRHTEPVREPFRESANAGAPTPGSSA